MMEIFRLVFSPIEVNTYILAEESGDCAIIDCGCYTEAEEKKLAVFIQSRNLQSSQKKEEAFHCMKKALSRKAR